MADRVETSGDRQRLEDLSACEVVSELRGALLGGSCPGKSVPGGAVVEAALEVLSEQVDRMSREQEGMANALMRSYEQLGIVFEVTRNMLTLESESEVVARLMESLRATYFEDDIFTAWGDGFRCHLATGEPAAGFEWESWLEDGLKQSRDERCEQVVGSPDGSQEALISPIFAGDVFVVASVLTRKREPGDDREWESGDMQVLESLSSFCGDVIQNFRLVRELQNTNTETVRTLVTAVDQKDPYTSGHSTRVGYYARLLAKEIGYDAGALRLLEWSALLHDVGKIGIRDDVLKKEGKLTDEEFAHIKEHPMRGYEIIRDNSYMRPCVDGVLHHHERYDGKGYPFGLTGENIPLDGRVIQIADIFDALTTTRSYRAAFPWEKAIEILKEEAGTVVDARLCGRFVAMIERFYKDNPDAFNDIGNTSATLCLVSGDNGTSVETERGMAVVVEEPVGQGSAG